MGSIASARTSKTRILSGGGQIAFHRQFRGSPESGAAKETRPHGMAGGGDRPGTASVDDALQFQQGRPPEDLVRPSCFGTFYIVKCSPESFQIAWITSVAWSEVPLSRNSLTGFTARSEVFDILPHLLGDAGALLVLKQLQGRSWFLLHVHPVSLPIRKVFLGVRCARPESRAEHIGQLCTDSCIQ